MATAKRLRREPRRTFQTHRSTDGSFGDLDLPALLRDGLSLRT